MEHILKHNITLFYCFGCLILKLKMRSSLTLEIIQNPFDMNVSLIVSDCDNVNDIKVFNAARGSTIQFSCQRLIARRPNGNFAHFER